MINIFNFRLFLQYLLLNLFLFTGSVYPQQVNISGKDNDPYFGWEGHSSGFISSISMNNDYTQFATSGIDNTLRIWDAKSFSLQKVYTGYSASSLAFSNNGKYIAAGLPNNQLRIINLTDYSQVQIISLDTFRSEKVIFSPDDSLIASSNYYSLTLQRNITIHKTVDRSLFRALPAEKEERGSLAFSPDGKLLITGNQVKDVHLWDIENRSLSKTLYTNKGVVWLKIISGGSMLMAVCLDSIYVWNTSDWNIIKGIKIPEISIASTADISKDESQIAVSNIQNEIILMNTEGNVTKKWMAHNDRLSGIKFCDDPGKIISALIGSGWEYNYSTDNTLKLWEILSGSLITNLSGQTAKAQSISLSPDNNYLATGGEDCRVHIWNAADGKYIRTIISEYGPVYRVLFSPDGKYLAVSDDGKIQIFNKNTWQMQKNLIHPKFNILHEFHFSPDSKCLLSTLNDYVIIWNTLDWSIKKEFTGFQSSSQAYSKDGNSFASFERTDLVLRDANTGNLINTYRDGNYGPIYFSKDGERLVLIDGNRIIVWRVNGYLPEMKFYAHPTGLIRCGQFSDNGLLFATAGEDGTIRIWDARNFEHLKTIKFEHGYPISISFSKDSKKIYSGGWGYNNLRIYDISDVATGIKKEPENKPEKFILYQNYPNPFNPSTVVSFEIEAQNFAPVQLKIYDILGREVKMLVNDYKPLGKYEYTFDGKGLSSGIYYCRLSVKGYPVKQIPMMLVK